MPLLKMWGRSERPASYLRTRMSVLALDDRAAPSSLLATEDDRQDEAAWAATVAYLASSAEPNGSLTPVSRTGKEAPTNQPPQIVDFVAIQVGPGMYQLTGRVIDEDPAGLVVTFGGIPSAQGLTATTFIDGTFAVVVQMQTDGTDRGTVTAVTQDRAGLWSNVAATWTDPR